MTQIQNTKPVYDSVDKVPSQKFYKTVISIYGSDYFYLVTPTTFGMVFGTKSTESFMITKI